MSSHDHLPQCKYLLGSLSEYLDGELQAELCTQIEEHLKGCSDCRIVVNTLRKTIEIFEQAQPPSALPEPVRERLFVKLNLEEFLNRSEDAGTEP